MHWTGTTLLLPFLYMVHLINSTCDSVEYIQAWCNTFCGNSVENIQTRFCNPTICYNNGENYKSRLNQEYQEQPALYIQERVDPHSCFASCEKPGPGCESCTNNTYFMCNQSGVCLHPELECDGHPQCHPPEDEVRKNVSKSILKVEK